MKKSVKLLIVGGILIIVGIFMYIFSQVESTYQRTVDLGYGSSFTYPASYHPYAVLILPGIVAIIFGIIAIIIGSLTMVTSENNSREGSNVYVVNNPVKEDSINQGTQNNTQNSTIYCNHCGISLPSDSDYCLKCGKKIG
jgi:uncharacterized membrane protein